MRDCGVEAKGMQNCGIDKAEAGSKERESGSMEEFVIETHAHTSETSSCAVIEAAEVVRLYHSAGYQGLMITDHYHRYFFESIHLDSWEAQVDRFLTGYRIAKREGQRYGMEILLGIEYRNVETDNDFLVIGITEQFLYEHPYLYKLPLEEAIDLFHENGMLVIQAHPVRCKIVDEKDGRLFTGLYSEQMMRILEENPQMPYSLSDMSYGEAIKLLENSKMDSSKMPMKLRVCDLLCEDKLDGIEAYNGNSSWIQDPKEIEEILKRHPDYMQTSASDFHGRPHLARGGMVLNRRVTTSQELAAVLREGGVRELIRSGK